MLDLRRRQLKRSSPVAIRLRRWSSVFWLPCW